MKTNLKLGVKVKQCKNCQSESVGCILVDAFSWDDGNVNALIGFDKTTKEILINENVLMALIQLVNPMQEKRAIKVVSQQKFIDNLVK